MQSLSEFDIDGCLQDRYSLRRLLGSGSSSEVVEALDTLTNTLVAIKKLTGPIQPRRVLREIHILTKLEHKNIIKLIDVRHSSSKKCKASELPHYLPRVRSESGAKYGTDIKGTKRDRDGNTVTSEDHESRDRFIGIYLVMEFLDTDLRKLINSPQYLTIEHIQAIMRQILQGLTYMHR